MNKEMMRYEIHLHGDLPLKHDVSKEDVAQALTPLWQFLGVDGFEEGVNSIYPEEKGLVFDAEGAMLSICWTIQGEDAFEDVMQEVCHNLNALTREGAPLEVSYVDIDEDNEDVEDYQLLFVGPSTEAILSAQRDLLLKDLFDLMERHFDATELGNIVTEVERLFEKKVKRIETNHLPVKTIWSGFPTTGLCDPSKKRLH